MSPAGLDVNSTISSANRADFSLSSPTDIPDIVFESVKYLDRGSIAKLNKGRKSASLLVPFCNLIVLEIVPSVDTLVVGEEYMCCSKVSMLLCTPTRCST